MHRILIHRISIFTLCCFRCELLFFFFPYFFLFFLMTLIKTPLSNPSLRHSLRAASLSFHTRCLSLSLFPYELPVSSFSISLSLFVSLLPRTSGVGSI